MDQTAKSMLRRNGLRMLLRTPGKTLLFGFLIFVLATVLAVCATLAVSSITLLLRRDTDYTTTALLQASDGTADASAALDDAVFAGEPSVLGFQKTRQLSLWPVDYQRQVGVKESCFSVVAVRLNSPHQRNPLSWNATVVEPIYAPDIVAGQTVELNFLSLCDISYAEDDREGQEITPENCEAFGYYCITDYYTTYLPRGETNETKALYYFIRGERPKDGEILLAAVLCDRTQNVPRLDVVGGWQQVDGTLNVSEISLDWEDPAQAPYFDLAEKWRRMTNCVNAVVSEDPRYLEEFSQGDYCIQEGAFYAPGDAGRCLLPSSLAGEMGLSVGDVVTFEILPPYGIYEPQTDGALPKKAYEVAAILSVTADSAQEHAPYVYLSDADSMEDRFFLIDEAVGTLHLKNGTSVEELERIKALLPSGVRMTVFDQGYEAISKSLTTLLHSALRLLAAASLAALALLTLFAYLFVGRQRETLKTMWMLGTPTKALKVFLLRGAGTVLSLAALLSCIATAALTGALNGYVLKRLTGPAMLYSNASLGVIKTPERAVLLSVPTLLLCALLLLSSGLCLCLLFFRYMNHAAGTARAPLREKKNIVHRKTKEKTASHLRGAGTKYLLLSIWRGKGRSLSVIAVSLILPLFLSLISFGIEVNQKQLSSLTERTRINGYLTDFSGKMREGLFLPMTNLAALDQIDGLENISYAQADAAAIVSDGEQPEALNTLVYTNDILCWKEYDDRSQYEITWYDGFDGSVFQYRGSPVEGKQVWIQTDSAKAYRFGGKESDPRMLWVVMPEEYLREHGLQLGDSVRIMSKDARVLTGSVPIDAKDDYLIVGSLKRTDGRTATQTTFYTSLANYDKYLEQVEPAPNGELYSVWYLWVRDGYSCCRFELSDTKRLQEVKDSMNNAGISQIRKTSRYRIFPVFDDRQYLDASAKLQNSIASYTWLLWIASVLCFGAGIALSLLLLSRRQTESVILRTLGMHKIKTAVLFFGEQAGLCLTGTAFALLLHAFVRKPAQNAANWLPLFVFLSGYMIGTAIFCGGILQKNPAEILREKE